MAGPKPKRSYSENDRATALALLQANDGNILRTARELDIPQSTLRKWRDGEGVSVDVAQKCEQKKEELGELFERVARLYLSRATEKDAIDASTGKDAVITAATAADKMQLLRGKPTANLKHDVNFPAPDEFERQSAEDRLRVLRSQVEMASGN